PDILRAAPATGAAAPDIRVAVPAIQAAAPNVCAAAPDLRTVAPAAAEAPAWSLARRIAFRFAFCYLVLYNFPVLLFALPVPGLAALFMAYSKLLDAAVVWIGAHVLHLSHAVEVLRGKTGSGDTTYDYVRLLCFAALAAVAALVWTLAARRTREHRRLHEGLRIFLRYSLGSILL